MGFGFWCLGEGFRVDGQGQAGLCGGARHFQLLSLNKVALPRFFGI